MLRYAPAIVLVACSLTLGLRIWKHEGNPGKSPGDIAPTILKSPYRDLRAQQAAALKSPHRKPVLPAEAEIEPISVEEARRLVAEARQFNGSGGRGRVSAEVISRLCAANEPAVAFTLIEPESSEARNSGIKAFFQSAQLDESTIISKIAAFSRPEDKSHALTAYLRRVPFTALETFVSRNPELHPFLKNGLTESLEARMTGSDRDSAMAMADAFHRMGLVDDKLLLRKIMEDEARSPFLRWNELNERIPKDSPHFSTVAQDLLEKMTDLQPANLADWAKNSVGKNQSTNPNYTLRLVLGRWAKKDPSAAVEWFHKHSTEISRAQHDDIAWAFAVSAQDSGKAEEAQQWFAQVGNPETRKMLNRVLSSTRSKEGWD